MSVCSAQSIAFEDCHSRHRSLSAIGQTEKTQMGNSINAARLLVLFCGDMNMGLEHTHRPFDRDWMSLDVIPES